MTKEIFGYLSIALTLVCIAPYYYAIYKRTIKPHAFSWVIWGTVAAIAACAQYSKGAGPGAWGAATGAFTCLSIAALGFYAGESTITRSDWIALTVAFLAIPCWIITKDPLSAVILITIIDTVGYYPTFRKSYYKPHEEMIFMHAMGSVKYALSLMAIEHFSLTTALYPFSIVLTGILLSIMLMIRRRQLRG